MIPDPRHLIIYALLAICAGLGGYTFKLKLEIAETQREAAVERETFERERARAAEVLAKRQGEYRQVETNLTAALTIERDQADEARNRSARQRDDLLARLRAAQARAAATANLSGATPTAGPGQATPGSDEPLVPRPLGEEDVHEADRGDLMRTALLGCYRAYDRARAEIETLNLRSKVE